MNIPETYAQINYRWTWPVSGQVAEVAFGVSLEDPGMSVTDVATAATAAYNLGDLRTVQVATIQLSNVHVKFGPNDTGPSHDTPLSEAGTLTGEGVQPNTGLLITKNTATGGRKGRGRAYWPGIQDAVIDAYGHVTTSALATFQTKFTAWAVALDAALIPLYLLHADPDTLPYEVTSLTCQSLVGTQRRRLGR